mmetsp:Transcript_1321/g.2119  ORF Transcript_1321/g.2119 Transcript_1321/m.2119 type:complete len:173 (+) Transcript_1321:137-655(+)
MQQRSKKGLLTLSMLLLAESVTHINAVTLWSTYNKHYNNFNHQQYHQQKQQHSRNKGQTDFYDEFEARLASQAIEDGVPVADLSACTKLAAAASVGITLVGAKAQAYSTHAANLTRRKRNSRIAKKMGSHTLDGFSGVTTARVLTDLLHLAKECGTSTNTMATTTTTTTTKA